MERIPKAAYTVEFREQAVRMHGGDWQTIAEAALDAGGDVEERGLYE